MVLLRCQHQQEHNQLHVIRLLTLAAMISVLIRWVLKMLAMVFTSSIPLTEISSNLPKKGDTKVAPALAANNSLA